MRLIKWEDASTGVRHNRMRKLLASDKPSVCPLCQKDKKLELSNKDHEYKEALEDWWYLCHQCHRQYDMKQGNYKFYEKFNSLFS